MKRFHYFSGITISLFIGIHLFNHFLSIFSPELHIEKMGVLRVIYRNPFSELIILLAVIVQITTGMQLFFKTKKVKATFFEKIQIYSGLYLAFFLLIHVSAILFGRYLLDLDTNFYFGIAGLNTFPHLLFFLPYYSLAVFAFFGHIASIHALKMKKKLGGLTPHQQAFILLILGVLLGITILLGLTNFGEGYLIPKEYNILIDK